MKRKSSRNRVAAPRASEQVSLVETVEFARLLKTEEVAEVLRVHPRTLARILADELLRFPTPMRVGRCLRWRADQLKTWMEAQQ